MLPMSNRGKALGKSYRKGMSLVQVVRQFSTSERISESKKLDAGRGAVGKQPIVGIKERESGKVAADAIETTGKFALQGFVAVNTEDDATVYTDEASAYVDIRRNHQAVKHSVKEFVGRHNARSLDTEELTVNIIFGMDGKRLRYKGLIDPRHTRQPSPL